MISLLIIVFGTLINFMLNAWFLTLSARAVGTSRKGYRFGIAALFLLFISGLIIQLVFNVIPFMSMPPLLAIGIPVIILCISFFVLPFLILRQVFRLSFKRTLAPFGMYVLLGVIGFGLAIGLVRPFVIQTFRITSKSMSPTLEPGDRMIANKLIQPHRWDLVTHWSNDPNPEVWCKRVIALPGESLRYEAGKIYIDGREIEVPKILQGPITAKNVPNRYVHLKDGDLIELQDDEYFVIGDNLDNSYDSRMYGPVKSASLVGVVDMVYWPLNKVRTFRRINL